MKEEFLHYIWQFKLFSHQDLKTVSNEEIIIVTSGTANKNAGTDFLNAQLKINEQLWVGNVEIHIKSSDWYAHNHEEDKNYEAVILHVVWEDDATVFMKNNKPLPTLVLKKVVDKKLLHNYQDLFSKQKRFIPCETQISTVNSFVKDNWLERLYFERLEQKSVLINQLLEKSNNDYEAVLFQLLAKNFGLKVNGDAFLQLATSLDFSIIRKERFDEQKLAALLFGQAGFLSEDIEETYHKELKITYEYLQYKYKLQPLEKHLFQFFRMRPANFPTIRIAQLVALFFAYQNLFSKLMEIEKIKDFYTLLTLSVNSFWQMHYTFDKTSTKRIKKLTKPFIDLLLINTVIPLKFKYLKSRGEAGEEKIIALMQQLKPEKNSIISDFSEVKMIAKNAFESQALLELKNQYCNQKRCLDCAIGNVLLREI